MRNKVVALSFLLLLVKVEMGVAQTAQTGQTKLGLIFTNIYNIKGQDTNGITVDSELPLVTGEPHFAHFAQGFQNKFKPFNAALATQLSTVPLPSPASGFTYQYDAAAGAFRRSSQSFGPILADRAETLGRKKLSVGFNYQHFGFRTIEGIDLNAVPAVFVHDADDTGARTGGRLDVITTTNSIKASVNQFSFSVNYGLTDRIDVSVAVPTVRTSLSLTSDATIQRLGTTDVRTHFFFPDPITKGPAGSYGATRHYPVSGTSASGTMTGIGDLIFRLKGNVIRGESFALAVGSDFRAPTGDAQDLLGSGAPGVKPFAALTFSHKNVAPHVNVGYQWNGNSILAPDGDVAASKKGGLPGQFLYTGGVDVGVTNRLTLAFDVLGQTVINSSRLVATNDSFTCGGGLGCPTGPSQAFPNINFPKQTYNIINGAAGFKVNPTSHLLISVNLLFKMNNTGLRSNVTPLVGLEYSF